MEQLDTVLKYLKLNKSRDPLGFANKIVQPSVAGQDLKLALLKLGNRVKSDQMYPEALEICNISSLYKTINKHLMKKRNIKKYKVNFARTKRYKKSAIPFMAELLNKEDQEKKLMMI